MREKKGRVLMNGKSKCKILKDIRRQIAADNDIEFVTSECKYQGECTGTCPKCEAEVRYLERELEKRQQVGKAVAIAGIAATILVSTAGCLPSNTTMGDPLPAQTAPGQEGGPVTGEQGIIEETVPTTQTDTSDDEIPTPLGAVPEPTLIGVPADPNLWD